ncbi:MAG: T9SS type A sorting domain-containing protein, partial [Bacteroidetes bacterium]|nr:T9SS type A sorting domain-containing protein [Bacteroidota bacterium]
LVAYKTVIASAGGSYTSAGLSADWTVGQNVANQYTSSGLTVTEGFHPIIIEQGPTDVPAVASNINSVMAYPNPTSAVLNISINQQLPKAVVIEVLDISGRQVRDIIKLPAQSMPSTQIDMSALSPGSYIILLNPRTIDAYTMKVIKQ